MIRSTKIPGVAVAIASITTFVEPAFSEEARTMPTVERGHCVEMLEPSGRLRIMCLSADLATVFAALNKHSEWRLAFIPQNGTVPDCPPQISGVFPPSLNLVIVDYLVEHQGLIVALRSEATKSIDLVCDRHAD